MIALQILKDAVKAVPAVKYALGIAGIVSVVALVPALGLDYRIAMIGTVVMVILMTMLLIFARLTKTASKHFLIPILVLLWSTILLTISTASLLFSSVFFEWPAPLRSWLVSSGPHYVEPDNSDVQIMVISSQSWKLPPGHLYRSLDFELRLINQSSSPVPIDPVATLVISGNNGNLRSEITLDVTSDQKLGAVINPNTPMAVYVEGQLAKNHQDLLDKGYTAYIQLFYDKSLTKEKHWYVSDFFDFSTKQIKMEGDGTARASVLD